MGFSKLQDNEPDQTPSRRMLISEDIITSVLPCNSAKCTNNNTAVTTSDT